MGKELSSLETPLNLESDLATDLEYDDDEIPTLLSASESMDAMVLGHGTENATAASAVYNLSTTIIGAGIMGLPAKMKILGLPCGLGVLLVMGGLSYFSVILMLRCSSRAHVWSYADLMGKSWGKWGRTATRTLVAINNVGILIIYMIIIGDVLCGTTAVSGGAGEASRHHSGLLEDWAGGPRWWTSRVAVFTTTFCVVLAPLVSLQHVDSLHWSSALSILLAVVFVAITVFVTLVKLGQGSIDFSELRWAPAMASWSDLIQLCSVMPTMATAYVCHYNVHPIYVELSHPRAKKMRQVAGISLSLCTAVYLVTSTFGYLLFGEGTQGDVLANYDQDLGIPFSNVLTNVIRLSYAVHLMLVFPVVHFSLRGNVDGLLFPHSSHQKPLCSSPLRFSCLTAALMLFILIGALFAPSVELAFHFTGSVAAVSLAFTLPGMAALSPQWGLNGLKERILAVSMVAIGVGCTVTGLGSNVYSTFFL